MGYLGELARERDGLLNLVVHHDGNAWWAMIGVEVPEGACATEFRTVWQRFETKEGAIWAVARVTQNLTEAD